MTSEGRVSQRQPLPERLEKSASEEFFEDPSLYLRYSFQIQLRARIVRARIGSAAGMSVVDIGCGDGGVSRQFLSAADRVVFVDASKAMLDKARAHVPSAEISKTAFIHTDVRNWNPEEGFDVALCMGVLAYFSNPEEVLAKIAACLKIGGVCCLQLTDADRLPGSLQYRLAALRNALSGRQALLTRCSSQGVRKAAKRLGLLNEGLQRYSLLLPGMGFLPNAWLLRWESAVLRSSFLSRLGSECILYFRKVAR